MKIFILYFDGILKPDCRNCGKICCYGPLKLEFTNEEKKYDILNEVFPWLKHFMIPHKINKNFLDRIVIESRFSKCFFLDKDKYCKLQKEYGYDYKPFACRLAPHRFLLYNDVCIVSENSQEGCLTIRKINFTNNKISEERKRLLQNVKNAIKFGVFQRYGASNREKIKWSKQRFMLESKIFNLSRKYLHKSNYTEFAIRQLQIIDKDLDIDSIKAKIDNKIRIWREFLKIEERNLVNKRVTYELTALTSLFRFQNWETNEKVIPLQLFACYILMVFFSDYHTSNFSVFTYRNILQGLARDLMLLAENRKTKIRLLKYAGVNKKKIKSLIKNKSLRELLKSLDLNIEEKLQFIDGLSKINKRAIKSKY